jgi:hypothetical protein
MVENGGRSTATMCLQVLGGSRRVLASNHNDAPVVVILVHMVWQLDVIY